MDPKELMMKYGGVGSLLLSILLLVGYLGITFTGEGYEAKFSKLKDLDESVKVILNTRDFEQGKAPAPVPNYAAEVSKIWEKANIAKEAPSYTVYPVLGISFKAFEDPADQEKLSRSIKGRFLALADKEEATYFGPRITVKRGKRAGLEEATPAQMLSVEQTAINSITIMWDDANPEMIAKTGVEEYQLYRYTADQKENAKQLTPAGYLEKSYVDSNFDARTEYSYYVITKVAKVSPNEPPLPKIAPASKPISVKTQSDFKIFFVSVIGGGAASFANVEVYKYHQGQKDWIRGSFQVRRGDKIGEPKKLRLANGKRAVVDFSTNCEVYEYYNDEERVVEKEGGKKVTLQRQARLVYFDGNENRKRKSLWKFNATYDKNPYKKKKVRKSSKDKDKDKDKKGGKKK